MSLQPTPEELAAAFNGDHPVQVKRLAYLTGRQIVLVAAFGTEEVSATLSVREVLSGTLPAAPTRLSRAERGCLTRAIQGEVKTSWTEDELRQEGRPLYFSQAWFVREFEASGSSYRAMSKNTGYNENTLSKFGRDYGIEQFRRVTPELRAQATALLAGGTSQREVAAKLQLSPATVSRIARGVRDDAPKDS